MKEYKSAEMKYQKIWEAGLYPSVVLLAGILISYVIFNYTDISLGYFGAFIGMMPLAALFLILMGFGYVFYYEHMSMRYLIGNDSLVIRSREFKRRILYAFIDTITGRYEEVTIPYKDIEHIEVAATPKISTVKDEYEVVGLDGYVPFIKQFMYVITNRKNEGGRKLIYYIDPDMREDFIDKIAAKGVKVKK